MKPRGAEHQGRLPERSDISGILKHKQETLATEGEKRQPGGRDHVCKGVKANNRTCSVSYKQTTRVPTGVIRGCGNETSLENILTKISKDLGY